MVNNQLMNVRCRLGKITEMNIPSWANDSFIVNDSLI